MRSNNNSDRSGDLTGGNRSANGVVDAGEVVGGAGTDGGCSCCGETVGGSAKVTGSDAVGSGKNCCTGINWFAITKKRVGIEVHNDLK